MATPKKEQTPKESRWRALKRRATRIWVGPRLSKGDLTPPSPFRLPSPYATRPINFNGVRNKAEEIAEMDSVDDGARKEKALALEEAKLELTKESLQFNLTLIHRSVMISMLTSTIALAALIVAILK
jgi:hypothetical protein